MKNKCVDVLKALSDLNRMRIFNIVWDQKLCVCQIEEVLAIKQANLSRHISKLRDIGLVSYVKDHLYVYYFVPEEIKSGFPFLIHLIDQIRTDPTMLNELNRSKTVEVCALSKK